MLEILIVLATLTPFIDVDATEANRQAELHRLLKQALMLNSSGRRDVEPETLVYIDESEREIDLELAHFELIGGYLAKTCVYERSQVQGLRNMKAFAEFLRLVGLSDREVAETIIANAGEDADQVRRLLSYAGVRGIDHFICLDYMRERLRQGMTAETLREYIDHIDDPKLPAPEPVSASL